MPSLSSERLAAMRESLARIVAPVREEVEELDKRLAEIDAEKAELTATRRELMAVIRAADPEERKKAKPGPKADGDGRGGANSARAERHMRELVDKVEVFMKANVDDDELTPTKIARAIPYSSGPSVKRALDRLAEAGVVRADRKTRGGGLAYKLVAAP